MTTTTANNGRLCNQIIRNLVVSFIAEKHDLQVTYSSKDLIQKLGIELFCGNKNHKETVVLKDDNYFDILSRNSFSCNLNPNNNYFQTKEITNYLFSYLHKTETQSNIIRNNAFKSRYKTNNDIFVHIRLGDIARHSPGVAYYLKAIREIGEFDQLIIASDDIKHPLIREIVEQYPMAQLNPELNDEISTIQFGSTCKNVILSHGSFSAIIGYLAFFSNVYYPQYESGKIWYGDMFSVPGWNEIKKD
jgi:hypothetical protein